MKSCVFTSCVLVFLASAASAGEPIGKSTLSNMGLGSMQSLSDVDGLAIRGKGTMAGVWGNSSVLWNGQAATNNYQAAAQWVNQPSFAKGESKSFAGIFEATYLQDPTGSALSINAIGGLAGGAAKASAF